MAKRYIRSTAIIAERASGRVGQRDKKVTPALASIGALGALTDGWPKAVECDGSVTSIDQHGLAISRYDSAKAFNNNRARQVGQRGMNEIVKTLRLSARLSLRSVAGRRAANPIGAADLKIRSGTIRRLGDRKRRRQNVGSRRSRVRWNPVVSQNPGCSLESLSSRILWRTKVDDDRLPLLRKE